MQLLRIITDRFIFMDNFLCEYNEQHYDRALAEIEGLWEAQEGTEAGDKLDILLILVEDYEDKHHRISPPGPKEAS